MSDKVKLSAPWEVYARKLEALFAHDEGITITGLVKSGAGYEVVIYAPDPQKAFALRKLLPESKDFGGVTLSVVVTTSNQSPALEVFVRTAFAGNTDFFHVSKVDTPASSNAFVYAEFEPEVAQFWCDNLGSPHGLETKTLEEIARDVFQGGLGENVLWTTRKID